MLEVKGEKEKPVLSLPLDLYPKGRIPGHLLGRPQLSWSQMGGKVGEEGRKWDGVERRWTRDKRGRDEGMIEWRIKGGMQQWWEWRGGGREVAMEGKRKAGVGGG